MSNSSDPGHSDEIIRTSATVQLTAARDQGKPRVSILAYAGGVMDVPGFGRVLIDLAGLELPEQVPLLADHQNTLDGIIGHGRARIDDGKLHIDGRLASTDAAKQVRELASDGLSLRASVGVRPIKYRRAREQETFHINNQTITADEPFMLIERGALAEVSIVAIGADPRTAVSVAARGKTTMPEDIKPETPSPKNEPAAASLTIELERERTAGILTAAASHPDIAARAIKEGWNLQQTQLEVLRRMRPQSLSILKTGHGSRSPRDVLAAAALLHAGSRATAEKAFGAEICQHAADLRVTSSLDLCRAALTLNMQDVPVDRSEMIQAAFSTSTLAGALQAAAQREAMTTFTEAPSAWRKIAKTRSAPDFREHEGLRPYLKDGRLQKIGKDGEIKHAAVDQEKYPFQVHTFARMFSVDRQTIVNDDIGAVFELLRELGRQAARTIADEVAELILANPDDFFGSGNSNLLTGGDSALGIAALGEAVRKLREQKDADGKPIDVSPKALLVPPALEAIARQLLNSTIVQIDGHDAPVEAPGGNPWREIAELAVDSRFADEPKAWYLYADPNNVPAIVVSFLNGMEAPIVEQDDTGFSTLGQQFRCYIDFGVDDADPRGAVRSDGE